MIPGIGEAVTVYSATSDVLGDRDFMAEQFRQKTLAAKMVIRSLGETIKGVFSRDETSAIPKEAVAFGALNVVHYFSDESIGLAMLPEVKAGFASIMPEAAAATAAVASETMALTGIAFGLAMLNYKRREQIGIVTQEASIKQKSAETLVLGVPLAVQKGLLHNPKEIAHQSIFTFAGSHLLVAGGVFVAADVLNNQAVFYAAAAYLLGSTVLNKAYEKQENKLELDQ